MGNNISMIQLIFFVFLVVFSCNEEIEIEELENYTLEFSHLQICCPSPSDSSRFSQYTDTVRIQLGDKNELNEMFLLVQLQDSSLNVFDEVDIQSIKQINEKITQFYFGDYSRQFLGYVHDDYGLVYLARTDWEKDEYKLIHHPKFKQDEFNLVVLYCIDFHDNRKLPPARQR